MFIYLIVNHITGKYYVGQHKGTDLKRYLQQKLNGAGKRLKLRSHLFHSMRKHPKEAWSIHALLSNVQTKTELDQYEKDFIAFLHCQDPEYGYNICRGGEGFTGPMSDATKRKLKIVGNPVFSRTPGQEVIRKAALERARQEQGGSFLTPKAIEKIKAGRAAQDESHRLKAFNEWKEQKLSIDPDHFRKIGARASREDKQRAGRMASREDKQRAGRLGAERGMVKAQHTRWHVNRRITQPNCQLCQS